METKVCKWCGQELPVDSFRHYYNGRKGRYSYCKTCEKIDQRRKYLVAKGSNRTEEEEVQLASIHELYAERQKAGLVVPGTRKREDLSDLIGAQLTGLKEKTQP